MKTTEHGLYNPMECITMENVKACLAPYQVRVLEEANTVRDNVIALETFLIEPVPMDPIDHQLLVDQLLIMKGYLTVLQKRLDRF